MRALSVYLGLVAALLAGPLAARCSAQVTLAWNASSDPTVVGYYLVWGTSSGDYTFTNTYGGAQTNATISSLTEGLVYYFNVAAFNSNGVVSAYANEIVITNGLPATNAPPAPPAPPGTNTTGSGGGATGGTGGGGTNSHAITTNLTQSLFWGVPPFLTVGLSNGQPNLTIGGTVGATLTIQATTNLFSLDQWSEVTNVSISNIASVGETNQSGQTQDALDLAFVPGAQSVAVTNSSAAQFFRAVMPYDYVILAGMVLPAKGYTPRLIVVNMPGIVCDDACYVNESSSFIHWDRSTYALQLEGSASTIRQIATTLADSLNLDWTSASEFSYSNGLGQILATVIETESPSSDPVAGQAPPSAPIVINF
jgi:hypothetical protein